MTNFLSFNITISTCHNPSLIWINFLYQFAKEVFRGEAALEGPTIIRVKNVMEEIISNYRSHIKGTIELKYSPGAVKYFELAVTALNAFLNGDKNTYKSLREALCRT